MENNSIKELLKDYDKKHTQALADLENRKKLLYDKYPVLLEIENKLHSLGISTAQYILNNNNPTYLDNLKNEIEKLKLEQKNILNKLNIDENYLKPNYECSICNDTGYVSKDYQTVMCSCLKQKLLDIEYNKCNISNLNQDNFNNFDFNLYSDEINKEKYNSNISPRENIKIIKNLTEEFIDNFDDPNSKNLLFTGNTRTW